MDAPKSFNCSKVYWIIINYFNDEDTLRFVEHEIREQKDSNIVICVVNNGSDDLKKLSISLEVYNALLLNPGINTGYAGALVHALKSISSRISEKDIIVFSNTDMCIEGKTEICKVVEKYVDENFGMVGPSIVSKRTGMDQNPFSRERLPQWRIKFLIFIFRFYPIYLVYQWLSNIKSSIRRKIGGEVNMTKQTGVYAIHGSFIILSRKFSNVILKHEELLPFLFGEELFFAELCLQENCQVFFDSEFKVIHDEHAVTGLFKSRLYCKYLRQSLMKFHINYYSK